MRGHWTSHTHDCQGELLTLLREAGGRASVEQLYKRGAWGIRTQTIKALLRKGLVTCVGSNIWSDPLILSGDSQSTVAGEKNLENETQSPQPSGERGD